ncbi:MULTISPECIES: hypothetical protein [Klebsiella pneumoniae complex]|uniref:hypothetical protein n=1 Tax=Klebsiella pneumoniae complex TaxID=3390273 RepID=UPI001EF8FA38|nr:hypothetical protein [Klebsiella quasipneumoniae]HBQ6587460.1 hypothetical protein [Klebsiella quasipneumoniae subsp. similipneumoniae]HBR5191010.1 hypothetical protein [Klebsiella pneumoniae]ULJ34493.1 hypothetical protein HUZ79_19490 [Klebsiella quasipneumoniae]HCB2730739.1 hypothetical protein [Klebsiella pneumoniae]HCQ7884830.1 hypothetical protein [Klebsiella pneumoniae]
MKQFCLALAVMASMPTMAAIQCGNYIMTGEGMTVINGETVTSQKVKFLGKDGDYANMKMDMGLMPARDGNNYGFEFVKRNGKAFLNVQLLQNSMDAPKIIGSFPCRKVPS